ncbi:peptide chain release factor N(5)-glutamine methyltransferase [candidate division KSB1 bacterium]|nr:peptide chain release factor N(5)-glutamine methyltransferase [candidate division KSB1 bacterium]
MPDHDNTQKRWTILELLNWTTNYLTEKGFENSRLNAEILLAHVLNFNRVHLYLNFDRPLDVNELAGFKALLKKRLNHEPIQYITGETEFMSLPFKVAPGVLIPRPETEMLVEKTMEYCNSMSSEIKSTEILDVGTGSGNIAVSLAKNISNCRIYAVDISDAALQIAKENARLNQVEKKIEFNQLNALDSWPEEYKKFFDVIVANPPYISQSEYSRLPLEIKNFEPKKSLLAGKDGLDFYRQFTHILLYLLNDKGKVFFEIGEQQATLLMELYSKAGFKNINIHKDLAGKDRLLEMNRN